MQTCRFCAEEIQDAAVACKHCGRDLLPPRAIVATRKVPTWLWVALVLGVLGTAFVGTMYYSDDHQDFLRLSDQRARWHQKCDRYLKTPLSNPEAAACNEELNAMVTYAKQRGW